MSECKICSFCGHVIDPEEMGWIEMEEFAPIGECEEPELVFFHHYECLKKWLGA